MEHRTKLMESKARSILLKYYVRRFLKSTMGWVPSLLFLFSLALLALVLFSSVGQRLYVLPFGPKVLEVTGTVTEEVRGEDGTVSNEPVSGVSVESGGFRVTNDSGGTYKLEFRSEETQEVPVIFKRGSDEIVNRVSFPSGEYKAQKDVTFR